MKFEIISACRVCGNKDIKQFFDLGRQPFAESFPASPEGEVFYPLSLSWCSECNLIQLNETLDPKGLFSHFFWVTGTSKTAHDFARVFMTELLNRSPRIDKTKDYVLEIASNDGTFLLPFVKAGYRVLGVDSAQNLKEIAEKNGVSTIADFWGNRLAQEVLKQNGSAPIVFARNVLPHVANTHDFVEGLKTVLRDDGILAIEVHYAKTILEELHYDYVYHSHLCYFTLKSLEGLLNDHGLFVSDILPSPISGGSIIIYVKKTKSAENSVIKKYRQTELEGKTNELENWQQFAQRALEHRKKLLAIFEGIPPKNNVVGYGASARGSTLLNFCGIDYRMVFAVADRNSMKQGRFMPGTRIPIMAPEAVMAKNPQTVFLLAWNFAEEITRYLEEEFGFKGDYIVPLPHESRIQKSRLAN